ncbi:MAG: AmmeMemoRadiSam system protein B, partial [Candidatus Omnitrophota bacterium]
VLKNIVDGFIDRADPEEIQGEIVAIILPHAGYKYSGWVAGYGAKIIKDKKFDTVVVVGLSHRVPFKGLSVLDKDFYQTPLGNVAIDKDISKKIVAYNKNISYYELPFRVEHSAEVEIPFLQRTLKNFKIVVILTGDFSYESCCLLRDAISSIVKKSGKKILLVASADMSHFFPEEKARNIDARTIKEMEKFDPETLFAKCLSWSNSERPCNSIGLIGVMMAARELGADKLKVLKYATSGDVTFDKSQVVGYCSAVIYQSSVISNRLSVKEEKEKKMEELLNDEQKERLLEIARKTLETYIKKGETLEFKEGDPVLNKELGAFVTLHKYGELRGCIGNMIGKGPLYLTVRDMAIAASTQDPRFPGVTKDELDTIDIEISVLSQMEKISDPSKIIMGKHGVMVQSGFRSGVFLPQVATETGWDRETFMNSLCAHKAGLPPDAWKKGECEIFIYTAEVFGEK